VEQLVAKACSGAPELEIEVELPIRTRINKLSIGFHKVKEEVTRIQLELSLNIVELKL